MAHFTDAYADRVNEMLHGVLSATWFYKQEIVEVPGLLTALLITYDAVRDDCRELHDQWTWEQFLKRMSIVKTDWQFFDRELMEKFTEQPHKVMGGWEGRTIYFIKGGSHPEEWTPAKATEDVTAALYSSALGWEKAIQAEAEHLREIAPPGPEHFREFEHLVRVIFNFLFWGELGEGKAQSRTEPENEGTEIRDIIFANKAESGFWKDLKNKYAASEIVVDAKNKDELTRDDLRQLYCYLKPALGFWGFIVCRSEQPDWIHAFNRTLHKNFAQSRGLLILSDDDLRRMVQMHSRGQRPSAYLQDEMSEFVRSI